MEMHEDKSSQKKRSVADRPEAQSHLPFAFHHDDAWPFDSRLFKALRKQTRFI
jgi:hypothetical protein